MTQKLIATLLALCLGTCLMAQTTLHGNVTDQQGRPLPGARVLVPATGQSTTTDINGDFTLSVPEGTQSLTVQYAGYNSRTLSASGNLSVALAPNMKYHRATWRPFVGVMATASESLYRPALGLTLGNINESEGWGYYVRSAFYNIPHTSTATGLNSQFEQTHHYYYGGAGVMLAVYRPVFLNLGAGVSVHDIDTDITYSTTSGVALPSTFDMEEGTHGYFNLDLGVSVVLGHIQASVGTLYEAFKTGTNKSHWYPYAACSYVF